MMDDEDESEDDGQDIREDLSMREDLMAQSSPSRHETPPSENQFYAVELRPNGIIASFIEQNEQKKYESCEGLYSEAKPKKPR